MAGEGRARSIPMTISHYTRRRPCAPLKAARAATPLRASVRRVTRGSGSRSAPRRTSPRRAATILHPRCGRAVRCCTRAKPSDRYRVASPATRSVTASTATARARRASSGSRRIPPTSSKIVRVCSRAILGPAWPAIRRTTPCSCSAAADVPSCGFARGPAFTRPAVRPCVGVCASVRARMIKTAFDSRLHAKLWKRRSDLALHRLVAGVYNDAR